MLARAGQLTVRAIELALIVHSLLMKLCSTAVPSFGQSWYSTIERVVVEG